MLELEHISCNLCGSKKYTTLFQREDLNLRIPGRHRLVTCSNCGLVYQNPRPVESCFELIYPSTYDQFIKPPKRPIQQYVQSYGLFKRLKEIEKLKSKGYLLDVGCATGDFLEYTSKKGWNVTGIEPSKYACQIVEERGLNVHQGTLEDYSNADESFDVITMWNVIEHLADPRGALQSAYKLLRPKGLLVITTPNIDSWDARIFGNYWIGYELPRHYFVFSLKTLSEMISHENFTIVQTKCVFGSHAATMSSVRFWLRSRQAATNVSTWIESILFSLPFRIFASPFFFILDKLKVSSLITFFCIK
jgi:2-polyprenyl-3-methyl-5-hydroxy-6-metoxy-1,4-benzoquinol methylase